MRRILSLAAAAAVALGLAAAAQAQPGFLVGLTSSSVKMSASDAISLYHAGLEIADHIQLSVQWFNNLGAMFSAPAESGTESLDSVKNFEGIKFSLAILF